MSEDQVKLKNNEWLVKPDIFLDLFPYSKDYLRDFFRKLDIFIKKCPAHIVAIQPSLEVKNQKIVTIKIGNEVTETIDLNEDVSFFDTLTILEQKIKPLYPSGYSLVNEEVDYSTDEIAKLIKEKKLDADSAFNAKKQVRVKYSIMIDRIKLLEDTFRIIWTKSDKEESFIRISKLPLSLFLREVKRISSPSERYAYVLDRSSEVNPVKYVPIELDYKGKILANFLKINAPFIKEPISLINADIGAYKWSRFLFKIDKNDDFYNEIITNLKEIENR